MRRPSLEVLSTERLVFWIEEWVGPERVPGIEALRKWRGVVRDMREPGVRAVVRRQAKVDARREKEVRREVERRGGRR